jgi:AcrR family transcriptional regulator
MTGQSRLRSEERKRQIVDVTLDSVAQCGVRGTTLTRIASEVGITTPALYAHFANRREILLETIELLFEKRTMPHRFPPTDENALERLRELGYRHTELVASESDTSVFALFEFIAAPQEEGLREPLGAKILGLVGELADIVREGQKQGTIREDADPEQAAWMMVTRGWAEDITHLLGVSESWCGTRSNQMLDLILDSITVPNDSTD